jgi:hypothetical protein
MTPQILLQQFDKFPSIVIVNKNILPAVATLSNVVRTAW